jgi:sulfur-carrier protein
MIIYLPVPLRRFSGGAKEINGSGGTVREVLLNLKVAHPELTQQVWDDEADCFRQYLNVFLNGKNIRSLQGTDTPVSDSDVLSVIPAIAGGEKKICCKAFSVLIYKYIIIL